MAIIIEYNSHKFKGLGLIDKELYNQLLLLLELDPDAKLFSIVNWSFMKSKLKVAMYLTIICIISAFVEPFIKENKILSAIFLIITIPSTVILFFILLRIIFEKCNFIMYKLDANTYHKTLLNSILETDNYEEFKEKFEKETLF